MTLSWCPGLLVPSVGKITKGVPHISILRCGISVLHRSGCPTLATPLFLWLGWDPVNLRLALNPTPLLNSQTMPSEPKPAELAAKQPVFLLDTMSFIFRAYHAMQRAAHVHALAACPPRQPTFS
jgi:hypothetical protein